MYGPMVLAAIEQNEPPGRRLVDDDLAAAFLPRTLRMLVRATRFRPLRSALIAASERSGPGLWTNMAGRKHFIDDKLDQSVAEMAAVVILGAGLDTRGYRLARHRSIPVFEVDQPVNIARKAAIVRRVFGVLPASVRLVPIDFERGDLSSVLTAHGYRPADRTFFVWEGVTQYLTEVAVRDTLTQLSHAAPGSRLVFTYVRQEFIDGADRYGAESLYRRFRQRRQIWKTGLRPGEVSDFLAGFGWRLIEQVGPQEYLRDYVRPAGRDLAASDLEWTAYAEKV